MFFLGIAIAFILIFSCKFFITLIFGEEYKHSIVVIKLLALSIPFIFASYSTGSSLMTKNHMSQKVKYMGIATLINVILSLIFINYFGIVGAVTANLLINIFLSLLYLNGFKKHVLKSNH